MSVASAWCIFVTAAQAKSIVFSLQQLELRHFLIEYLLLVGGYRRWLANSLPIPNLFLSCLFPLIGGHRQATEPTQQTVTSNFVLDQTVNLPQFVSTI